MKKIVALILALVCLFACVACQEPEEPTPEGITKIAAMYKTANPAKTVVHTVQDFGEYKLEGETTLTIGTYNGKEAALYTYVYQELADVEQMNSIAKRSVQGSKEYFEGRGVRENAIIDESARFDRKAENFAPATGAIALNLDETALTDVVYENGIFTATVPTTGLKTVFGEDTTITTQTAITISVAGNMITGVTLTYTIPSLTAAPDVTVTITASYIYDVQTVTPIIAFN